MPIYRYKPADGSCKICGDGFDHRQEAHHADLQECPTCGKAVIKQLPTGVATPRVTRKPSISDAKSAGFTVLKKIGKGEYEKQ